MKYLGLIKLKKKKKIGRYKGSIKIKKNRKFYSIDELNTIINYFNKKKRTSKKFKRVRSFYRKANYWLDKSKEYLDKVEFYKKHAPKKISKFKLARKYQAIVVLKQTFHNFFASAHIKGNLLAWSCTGRQKFKGTKKKSPFTAEIVAKHLCILLKKKYIKIIKIIISTRLNKFMKAALKGIVDSNLIVKIISIKYSKAHNGIRNKKKRRL
jgi:ribosomal protein S11